MKKSIAFAFLGAVSFLAGGCESRRDGPMEEIGEELDDVGDEIEDVFDD
jgi:hypothetical protein